MFVFLGFVFFGLGAVGAFVPVLPTTPFLLAAAGCFAKGSPRFNSWFLNTGLYRRHLAGFVRERAMTLRQKLAICVPVSVMLLIIAVFTPMLWARIIIGIALLIKWWFFLFRIATIPVSR
ncbi:MAG: YbaN family protein [Propionibacteriaceae bacterium]|nr:YbaN family protein [Propionibacteriaceae bacterium]